MKTLIESIIKSWEDTVSLMRDIKRIEENADAIKKITTPKPNGEVKPAHVTDE